MKATIKIDIGLGIRGSHCLQFVADHPDTESVACVDADAAALERAKSKVPGKCGFFSRVADGLAASGANAALITSPPQLHAEHAIAALRAGLAVMVEKPFAANIQHARAILEVAQQTGKQVLVAQN